MQKKFKIISAILGDSYRSNDEHLFACPYCKHHKKKLSINIEKNVYKCWICETTGKDIRRIVRRYGDFNQLQEWDKLSNRVNITDFDDIFAIEEDNEPLPEKLDMPQGFTSLNNEPSLSASPALNYLKRRGVTEADILYWKMGYCMEGRYAKRVIVPSFDVNGDLNYFIARAFSSDPRKYLNPPCSKDVVFNELTVDWDSDVVLVEGIFDAMRTENGIPILGSSLRQDSKLFKKIVTNDTPVFMALDADAKKKENRIINDLLKYDVEVYKIDTSGYDDVGEMPKEVFENRKKGAEFVSADSYMLYEAIGSI